MLTDYHQADSRSQKDLTAAEKFVFDSRRAAFFPAFIVSRFPCWSELFLLREFREFRKQGNHFRIFTLEPPKNGYRYHTNVESLSVSELFNARCFRQLPGLRFVSGIRRLRNIAPRGLVSTASAMVRAVVLACKVKQYGINHLQGCFATWPAEVCHIAAELADVGYSVSAHAHDVWARPPLEPVIRDATVTVTCSRAACRELHRLFPGANVHLVRHGIQQSPLRRFDSNDGPIRILAAGRFVPKKGFSVLLEALSILHHQGFPFRCRIAGDGPEFLCLQRMRDSLELGDCVEFTGQLAQRDLRKEMRRSAILAFTGVRDPRSGDRDGIPNVILEAMQEGCIIVSTPLDSVSEVVRNGETGFVSRDASPASLAASIRLATSRQSGWSRIVRASRTLLNNNFNPRRNANRRWKLMRGDPEFTP